MLPCLSIQDPEDGLTGDRYLERCPYLLRDLGVRETTFAQVADHRYRLVRQFGSWILLTVKESVMGIIAPSFFDHIHNVVALCAELQVSRVAARRIITRVENFEFTWIDSISQEVGYSVRGVCLWNQPDLPISVVFNAGFPWPTLVGSTLVNLAVKVANLPLRQGSDWYRRIIGALWAKGEVCAKCARRHRSGTPPTRHCWPFWATSAAARIGRFITHLYIVTQNTKPRKECFS